MPSWSDIKRTLESLGSNNIEHVDVAHQLISRVQIFAAREGMKTETKIIKSKFEHNLGLYVAEFVLAMGTGMMDIYNEDFLLTVMTNSEGWEPMPRTCYFTFYVPETRLFESDTVRLGVVISD